MTHFRVIRVPAQQKLPLRGWAVERTALGEMAKIVFGPDTDKDKVRDEVIRLRKLEPD